MPSFIYLPATFIEFQWVTLGFSIPGLEDVLLAVLRIAPTVPYAGEKQDSSP